MPLEYIYRKGEVALDMYFLEKGQADRIIRRGDIESRRIKLVKGDLFGEIALLANSPRRTDV